MSDIVKGRQPIKDDNKEDEEEDKEDAMTKEDEKFAVATLFEGVRNVPQISGTIHTYLSDGRFTASKDDHDMAIRIKNNLVVVFQAMVLFEDCLVKCTKTEEKFIFQRLQGVLGFRARRSDRSSKGILEPLAAIYVQARTQEIVSIVRSGRLPEPPEEHLTALLVALIDRRIFFLYRKRPLRIALCDVDHETRVTEYMGIVSDHINGASNAIFLYMGAMLTGVDIAQYTREKWKRPWE